MVIIPADSIPAKALSHPWTVQFIATTVLLGCRSGFYQGLRSSEMVHQDPVIPGMDRILLIQTSCSSPLSHWTVRNTRTHKAPLMNLSKAAKTAQVHHAGTSLSTCEISWQQLVSWSAITKTQKHVPWPGVFSKNYACFCVWLRITIKIIHY